MNIKKQFAAVIDRWDAALWLATRRLTVRWLRKLVDVADDRLHAREVKLRTEIAGRQSLAQEAYRPDVLRAVTATIRTEPLIDKGAFVEGSPSVPYEAPNSYAAWEARRSGVTVVSKKEARKRRERAGAAAFDLRYAR
jgi:hypothetical protein